MVPALGLARLVRLRLCVGVVRGALGALGALERWSRVWF